MDEMTFLRQQAAFRDLPFIVGENCWDVQHIPEAERTYDLGTKFAMKTLEHLRDFENRSLLAQIARAQHNNEPGEEIIRAGFWGVISFALVEGLTGQSVL